MKHLLLILLGFGLIGCATNYGLPEDTTETTMERARYCSYTNIGEYWGDCWIERSKLETSFFDWIDTLQMEKDWELLVSLNSELKNLLGSKKTTVDDANNYFETLLTDIDNIVTLRITNRVAEAERQRRAWGEALGKLGQQMSANSQAWRNSQMVTDPNSPSGIQRARKYLTYQKLLSDGRMQCTYGNGITKEIRILPPGGYCPNSI